MVIKIIKEGKKTKFTATCPDCGCEFEYDLKIDREYISWVYQDIGEKYMYNVKYITCPECKRRIKIGQERSTETVEQYKHSSGFGTTHWYDE